MSTGRDVLSPTASSWQTETDDDDMDFELASDVLSPSADGEGDDVQEGDEAEDGETTLYFDAEEGTLRDTDGGEVTLEMARALSGEPEELYEQGGLTPQFVSLTPRHFRAVQQQIIRQLLQAGTRGVFQPLSTFQFSPSEDDEYDGLGYGGRRPRRARGKHVGNRYPPTPSEEGKKLMSSGTFGANDRCQHTSCGVPYSDATLRKRKRLARSMLDREMGMEHRGRARLLTSLATQALIPSSKADFIVNMNAPCYSGQFSEDGSFFFACGRDFKVRMYDTANPYDWKYYKTVHYYGGQWTITDASLSPDNKLLAYSSIKSQVCLATTEQGDTSDPRSLDFADMGSGPSHAMGGGAWGRGRAHFGIWSLRFSGDGGEMVAGTSDQSVYVYDLQAQRSILRIPGHTDDVNAVCFGDKLSPHILYSGSDDTTLKVWDRRSLASMRPAGMFLGHTEGLTYIDSKGDGRYVISNAKDQTCKLWDLRKMISTDKGDQINPQDYTTNFDYRFEPYDIGGHIPHPHDCSLVTFRGHRVLKTLIRCHFSPPGSTDGRYIYSGSHDGKIYVWNLDGTTAGKIDVHGATKNGRPTNDRRVHDYHGSADGGWKTIVRDCSWHPSAPVIAATSWNGWDHRLGTCTVHSWNDGMESDEIGDPESDEYTSGEAFAGAPNLGSTPMGAKFTPELRHDARYYGSHQDVNAASRPTRFAQEMGLGAWWRDDEQDDDDD